MERKNRSKSWPRSSLAVSTTSPVSGSKALNMQNKTVSHILFFKRFSNVLNQSQPLTRC